MRTLPWRGRRVPREPALLLAVIAATGVAFLMGPPDILVIPVALVVLTLPGYALVRLARLEDRWMEILLGAVLSIALLGLASLAGAYLRTWSPRLAIASLLLVGALAVMVELGALRTARAAVVRRRAARARRAIPAYRPVPSQAEAVGEAEADAEAGGADPTAGVPGEPGPDQGTSSAAPPAEGESSRSRVAPIEGIGRLRDRRPPTGSWALPVPPIQPVREPEPAPEPEPVPAPAPLPAPELELEVPPQSVTPAPAPRPGPGRPPKPKPQPASSPEPMPQAAPPTIAAPGPGAAQAPRPAPPAAAPPKPGAPPASTSIEAPGAGPGVSEPGPLPPMPEKHGSKHGSKQAGSQPDGPHPGQPNRRAKDDRARRKGG